MRFISRYKRHRIQMVPTRRVERDGVIFTKRGRCIEFQDGVYDTEDKEEIEFLKAHRDFGIRIFSDEPQRPARGRRRRPAGRPDEAGPAPAGAAEGS